MDMDARIAAGEFWLSSDASSAHLQHMQGMLTDAAMEAMGLQQHPYRGDIINRVWSGHAAWTKVKAWNAAELWWAFQRAAREFIPMGERIAAGWYETKLPYARHGDNFEVWSAYTNDRAAKRALFREDALADVGLDTHPARDILFETAWERGHSAGYSEVYHELLDLTDLLRQIDSLRPYESQVIEAAKRYRAAVQEHEAARAERAQGVRYEQACRVREQAQGLLLDTAARKGSKE